MFNLLHAFFFWKACTLSSLKDFSVENLETIPSTFLSIFSQKSIHLELLIIGVVFLHYT